MQARELQVKSRDFVHPPPLGSRVPEPLLVGVKP